MKLHNLFVSLTANAFARRFKRPTLSVTRNTTVTLLLRFRSEAHRGVRCLGLPTEALMAYTVARKLAIVLRRMWRDNTDFRWTAPSV